MKSKLVFEGYTVESINPRWASGYDNSLNLTTIIQKTKTEAVCRYDGEKIIKVRITIEVIK